MSDDTERRVEKWEMGRMENVDMSALEGLTFELPDGTVIITAAADEPTDGLEEVQVCKSASVSNWSTIYTHLLKYDAYFWLKKLNLILFDLMFNV